MSGSDFLDRLLGWTYSQATVTGGSGILVRLCFADRSKEVPATARTLQVSGGVASTFELLAHGDLFYINGPTIEADDVSGLDDHGYLEIHVPENADVTFGDGSASSQTVNPDNGCGSLQLRGDLADFKVFTLDSFGFATRYQLRFSQVGIIRASGAMKIGDTASTLDTLSNFELRGQFFVDYGLDQMFLSGHATSVKLNEEQQLSHRLEWTSHILVAVLSTMGVAFASAIATAVAAWVIGSKNGANRT